MIQMANKRAVIFDLDGTLIDSEGLHAECWKQSMLEHGFVLDQETSDRMRGKSKESNDLTLLGIVGCAHTVQSVRRGREKQYDVLIENGKVKLMPGAARLLAYLKENGYLIALATLSATEVVHRILDTLEVRSYFDVIVCGDQIHRPKPAPDIFLKVIEALEIQPQEAVIIEDSLTGVMGAMNAGIDRVVVTEDRESFRHMEENVTIYEDLYQVMDAWW